MYSLNKKINIALKKSLSLPEIKECAINLRLPNILLTNSLHKKNGIVDIPIDHEFILIDEFNNQRKLVKLMIGLKKQFGEKVAIGVVEMLNPLKWKNPIMAKNYFRARSEELMKDHHISITGSIHSSDLMYLQYKIDFETEDITVVAHIVEAIRYAVNKSAWEFNRC